MQINGQYNSANCMVDSLEESCVIQIKDICDLEFMKDSKIRIMADSHAGNGICVGFTATGSGWVVPNCIGVDISCSISSYKLSVKELDLELLDKVVHNNVPHGVNVRKTVSEHLSDSFKERVKNVCMTIDGNLDKFERDLLSVGTLGGGNHFIELNKDSNDNLWLTIHSGSRNFGKRICEYHQAKIDNSIGYLSGDDFKLYREHMKVAQEFAELSHKVMVDSIVGNRVFDDVEIVDTIFTSHNFIEFLGGDEFIIRKGAISAKKDEIVLIPLNMRDGTLVCKGLGNNDWNQSAPHGAGRILSRGKARKQISLDDFKSSMGGIYSTCVSENTLDESPFAYKDMNTIINAIGDSVEILDRMLPVYNFKAN